jgi:hypothetical protein
MSERTENATGNDPVITPQALAILGGGKIAYVKAIRSEDVHSLYPQAPEMEPGMRLFALHAADGTPLALTDSRQAALGHAMGDELEIASLH